MEGLGVGLSGGVRQLLGVCEEPSRDAERLLESQEKGMETAYEACTPWDALPAWGGQEHPGCLDGVFL